MPPSFKSATRLLTGQNPILYKIGKGAKVPPGFLAALESGPQSTEDLVAQVNTGGRSLFVMELDLKSGVPQFLNPASMTEADRAMATALVERYQKSMQRYVAEDDETKGTVSYIGKSSRLYVVGNKAVIATAKPVDYEILLEDADTQSVELDKLTRKLGHDPVITGLNGKELFALDLREQTVRAERLALPYGLIKFDVDRFKSINDDYSHDEADNILRKVASVIESEFPGATFGRPGGDEFTIFVPQCESSERVAALAEALRLKIRETIFEVQTAKGSRTIPITLSLGAAYFDPSLDKERPSLDKVSFEADKAMSKAKGGGRVLSSIHGDSVWYVDQAGSLKGYNNSSAVIPARGRAPLVTTLVPNDIARMVINTLVEKFKSGEDTGELLGADQNDPAVKYREKNIRNAAALIQAASRGILPVSERENIYLPLVIAGTNKVKGFDGEPDIIRLTQQRYRNIYTSVPPAEPTRRQIIASLRAIQTGAAILEKQGCIAVAEDIQNFVKQQLRALNKKAVSGLVVLVSSDAQPAGM